VPQFRYVARDAEGRQLEGVLEARSRGEALVLLRRQNLWVYRIDEAGAERRAAQPQGWGASPLYVIRPIGQGALAAFFEQLAQLIAAGIGPQAALTELQHRVSGGRLRLICREGAAALAAGGSISGHLARYPRVFEPHVLALMRAGERTGELNVACARIAEQFALEARVRRYFFWTRAYYGTVLLGTFWVLTVIIPGFAAVLRELAKLNNSTPQLALHMLLTRFWELTLYHFLPYVLLAWVLVKVFTVVLNVDALRPFRDGLLLGIPLVAGTTRRSALARFATSLAALFRAGVPLADALQESAAATGNIHLAQRLAAGVPQVAKGVPLSAVLGAARMLSNADVGRLATGEQSGMLDQTLERLATEAEEHRQSAIRRAMFLGPVLIMLLVAVGVGYAMYAFYNTYFNTLFEITQE